MALYIFKFLVFFHHSAMKLYIPEMVLELQYWEDKKFKTELNIINCRTTFHAMVILKYLKLHANSRGSVYYLFPEF